MSDCLPGKESITNAPIPVRKDYVTAKERLYGIPYHAKKVAKGLKLTRRIGEKIVINGNIIITISHQSGNQIGVHIDAPKDIVVDREEIHIRKQGESKHGSVNHR